MKKKLLLLALLFVAAVSCSKDDENTDPVYKAPTITFQNGAGYVFQDTQWPCDSSFMVGIQAASDAANSTKLVNFKIRLEFESKTVVYLDSVMNTNNFSYTTKFYTIGAPGQQAWIFTAKDSRGDSTVSRITLTTVQN